MSVLYVQGLYPVWKEATQEVLYLAYRDQGPSHLLVPRLQGSRNERYAREAQDMIIISPGLNGFALPGHIPPAAFLREVWCDAGLDQRFKGQAPTRRQYRKLVKGVKHIHIRELTDESDVRDYTELEKGSADSAPGWWVYCSSEHPKSVAATMLDIE